MTASLFAGCGAKTEAPLASAEDKGSFRTLDEIRSSGTINIGVPYPPRGDSSSGREDSGKRRLGAEGHRV